MSYLIVKICCNGWKYSNGIEHDCQWEGLLIVKTKLLAITLLGNPELLCFHALDHWGAWKSILGFSRSIATKNLVLKNNKKNTKKIINLEKNVTYLQFGCSRIDSSRCRILQSCSRSRKRSKLLPYDSFLSLGIEMLKFLGLEARILSLNYKRKVAKVKNFNP